MLSWSTVLLALLLALPLLLLLAGLSACILPPELQPGDFDAGPSSPPVIISAAPAPDFLFPGPIILDRQDTRTLSLTVLDNDLNDVLHVRLYVDYGRPQPQPAFAECQAAPTGDATRLMACPLNALCNPIADTDRGDHILEAMVADREFLSDSDPLAMGQAPFRALREKARASFSFRAWVMRCNPPTGS